MCALISPYIEGKQPATVSTGVYDLRSFFQLVYKLIEPMCEEALRNFFHFVVFVSQTMESKCQDVTNTYAFAIDSRKTAWIRLFKHQQGQRRPILARER